MHVNCAIKQLCFTRAYAGYIIVEVTVCNAGGYIKFWWLYIILEVELCFSFWWENGFQISLQRTPGDE